MKKNFRFPNILFLFGEFTAKFIMIFLSFLYRFGVFIRNFSFDRGIIKIRKLDTTVISVGNLTVGGTGKTPCIISLAKWLNNKKKNIVVISRGYGRKIIKNYTLHLSENDKITKNILSYAGDEPSLIASKVPGIYIGIGANRFEIGSKILKYVKKPIILLDDAYQHRYIYRDVNLLLIDCSKPFFSEALLPAGRLREPINQFFRADAVILSNYKQFPENTNRIRIFLDQKENMPIFFTNHLPEQIVFLFDGKVAKQNIFRDKAILAFSSIGNPNSFEETLKNKKLNIKYHLKFPDHHCYSPDDCKNIIDKAVNLDCKILITTEKDKMRLIEYKTHFEKFTVLVLPISMKIEPETAFYSWLQSILHI